MSEKGGYQMDKIACTLCALDRGETVMAVETAIVTHANGWSVYFSVCEECANRIGAVLNAPNN